MKIERQPQFRHRGTRTAAHSWHEVPRQTLPPPAQIARHFRVPLFRTSFPPSQPLPPAKDRGLPTQDPLPRSHPELHMEPVQLPPPRQAPPAALYPDLLPFDQYRLIIDARTPGEYAEDHIPGAVNLPVVEQPEFAEVGTLHRTDPHAAYAIGVRYSLLNIARNLHRVTTDIRPSEPILVYCFRGGKRSALWADNLRIVGHNVHVIKGGWKAYRRWVNEQLVTLPKQFTYRVLYGSTGCGKTRLLSALQRTGAQVLDLEEMAIHRGSLIGAVPGHKQPPQKVFDSQLVARMLRFDRAMPVWLESESRKIGQIQIPVALHDEMSSPSSMVFNVSMPMEQRVRLWNEDYAHHAADPVAMVQRLLPVRPLVGGEEYSAWMQLAQQLRVDELFERVMRKHYDPAYARSLTSHFHHHLNDMQVLDLESCTPEHLDQVAMRLARAA